MKECENSLIKSYEQSVLAHLKTLPPKFQSSYQKATLKKTGRKSAITAKCADCMGYERVFERVRDCRTVICPMWRFRPYQQKQKRYGARADGAAVV